MNKNKRFIKSFKLFLRPGCFKIFFKTVFFLDSTINMHQPKRTDKN